MLDPNVSAIVNENKQIFDPNSDLIDTLLTKISMQDQEKKFDNDQQPDSSELNDQENNERESSFTVETTKINRQLEMSNEELNNLILTLNTKAT